MKQDRPMNLEQIRAFLAASQEIRFEGLNRTEIYNWVGQTLAEQQYRVQGKAGKGMLRSYVAKTTGLSRAHRQYYFRYRSRSEPDEYYVRQRVRLPLDSHKCASADPQLWV